MDANTAPSAQQMLAQNIQARGIVLANSVEMKQTVFSTSVDPAATSVLNVQPRNVGLIKGFLVEVEATVTAGGAGATRTPFGSANLVKNFTFTDLNNTVRINAPGWFLATVNSARQGWGFGGVYANMLAMGYGNNFPVNSGPSNIAGNADAKVKHIYYVPLAYSGDDLRGSIFAGVVSATMNLAITLNTSPFSADKPVNAIYTGAGNYKAGSTVKVNVYQVYLDQLPQSAGGPILPLLDLNTNYELKSTSSTGLSVGQDFAVPYANFRDFLSTTLVYDNGGQLNGGDDINYFSLTSANFTNLMKLPPSIVALEARQVFMADTPLGMYYLNHRGRPINTIAFGNMELNVNPAVVNQGAQIIAAYEAFSQTNQLLGSAVTSL